MNVYVVYHSSFDTDKPRGGDTEPRIVKVTTSYADALAAYEQLIDSMLDASDLYRSENFCYDGVGIIEAELEQPSEERCTHCNEPFDIDDTAVAVGGLLYCDLLCAENDGQSVEDGTAEVVSVDTIV